MVFGLESADPFGAIVDVVKWFVSMKGGLDNQEIPIRLALRLPVRRSRPLQGFARVKLVCLMKQKGGQGSDVLIIRVLRIAKYKIFTKTMRGSFVWEQPCRLRTRAFFRASQQFVRLLVKANFLQLQD